MRSFPRFPICAALALFAGLLAAPAGAQLFPIFIDGFEAGHPFPGWSAYTSADVPSCDCYFSGDCPDGMFCNWGVLTQEDSCFWAEVKPSGVVGAGCNEPHFGGWSGGICDGICAPRRQGSLFGGEAPELLAKGVELWAESLLVPASDGGGPPLPHLADAALALEFSTEDMAMLLGREVANLLYETTDLGFYDHFCHWEAGETLTPDLYIDLAGDACRQQIGWLTAEALAAELLTEGAAGPLLQRIADHCPDWQQRFAPRCTGEEALTCLRRDVEEKAHSLKTYRGPDPDPAG